MPILRKILFYMFLLVYLVVCPFLILYALGITFRPETGTIVRTGLIAISSVPEGARVYLDGAPVAEPTPAVVRDVQPGRYRLRIEKDGYRPWVKTLEVRPELATREDRVLLIKTELSADPLTDGRFEKLVSLPGTNLVLLSRGRRLSDWQLGVWNDGGLIDSLSGEPRPPDDSFTVHPLCKESVGMCQLPVRRTFVVPGSSLALLELAGQDRRLAAVTAQNGEPAVTDLSPYTPAPFAKIQWEAGADNRLFVLRRNGTLDRIDLSREALFPHIAQDVSDFDLWQGELFVLTKSLRLERLDADGRPIASYLDEARTRDALFHGRRGLRIRVFSDRLVLFLDDRGSLLSSQLPHRLVDGGVRGIRRDRAGERLLVWTRTRIGVINFLPTSGPHSPVEHGPRAIWVREHGRDIRQAVWINHNRHILYRDGGNLGIVESERFDQAVDEPLVAVDPRSDVHLLPSAGRLIFLDPQTERAAAVTILPEETFFPAVRQNLEEGDDPHGF